MLFLAVVVDGDAAAAHVDAAADIAVADVGEVRQLGAFANVGVFHLNVVADFYVVADNGVGAQVYVRTCGYVVLNLAVMAVDELQVVVVTDFDISEAGVRTNLAVLADFRAALQPGVRINYGVAANFYASLDEGAGRVHDGYACVHELV